VLERGDDVGSSWAGRYDSLRLNTPRLTSSLGRYRMPRRYGRWPTRDHMVEYLRDYVRKLGLDVRFRTEVERVERDPAGWRVRTSGGDLTSASVVIALGHDRRALLPDWPGLGEYRGELVHAAAYREPAPFRGRDVLVVSAANTGSEIAYELVTNGAGRVRCAMRRPPSVVTREWLGMPLSYSGITLDPFPDAVGDLAARRSQRMIFGDLSPYGIGPAPVGMQTKIRREHKSPIVDAGFIDELKAGRIEIVAAVAAFDGDDVILADGERVQPEAVIVATGYSPDLEPIVGHLGVLDSRGYPDVGPGRDHPAAPGIYFNGYRASMTGQLCHMRTDARRIARAIARRASAPSPQR
jgi:cation diffusion facilitator CzcD-associated flavoprotein CzcO